MNFALSPEQEQLKADARRFLAAASSPRRVREVSGEDRGFDEGAWSRVAGELGWTALAIPEAYGGFGFGAQETALVMEEMGRALFPSPFLPSVCLAAPAILVAGTEEQKKEHLARIAGGAAYSLAISGGPARARPTTGGYLLSSAELRVLSGHVADAIVVPASHEDGALSLFVVPGEGLARSRLPTMDMTRAVAHIRLEGLRVPESARLGGPAASAVAAAHDFAKIALAAEQVGGAERCLEMAVDYAKVRTQFGRAIGSFQAIKHKLAEMLLDVETARSAAYHAACVLAREPRDAGEVSAAASLAHAYCSEAFFRCASECIQVHGGIGFTWEHDAHLFFKRARASEALFATPAEDRERIAARMGL